MMFKRLPIKMVTLGPTTIGWEGVDAEFSYLAYPTCELSLVNDLSLFFLNPLVSWDFSGQSPVYCVRDE